MWRAQQQQVAALVAIMEVQHLLQQHPRHDAEGPRARGQQLHFPAVMLLLLQRAPGPAAGA